MNGSGCKNCPVKPCHTLHYRGSYCAEQRAKLGLGDPMTNAERIRAMSDEELAKLISKHKPMYSWPDGVREIYFSTRMTGVEAWTKWLQQPAREGKK